MNHSVSSSFADCRTLKMGRKKRGDQSKKRNRALKDCLLNQMIWRCFIIHIRDNLVLFRRFRGPVILVSSLTFDSTWIISDERSFLVRDTPESNVKPRKNIYLCIYIYMCVYINPVIRVRKRKTPSNPHESHGRKGGGEGKEERGGIPFLTDLRRRSGDPATASLSPGRNWFECQGVADLEVRPRIWPSGQDRSPKFSFTEFRFKRLRLFSGVYLSNFSVKQCVLEFLIIFF